MYDRFLYTFVKVVECGSFSKASDTLFLTRASIMKQVNSLEERIGVVLLKRSNSGIELTPAGQSVYEDARWFIDACDESMAKARRIASESRERIRVGSSFLNPGQPLVNLYEQIREEYPQYKLKMMPYSDDHEEMLDMTQIIGRLFDVMLGVSDSVQWDKVINFSPLGAYPICAAVPKKHRLAGKTSLKPSDLQGETIMMVQEGDSHANDRVRAFLKKNYPNTRIIDTFHFYDLETFNEAVQRKCILLSFGFWSNVHPSLVTIPIEWDYAVPYGIMYERNPSESVKTFIDTIQKSIAEGKIDLKELMPELIVAD